MKSKKSLLIAGVVSTVAAGSLLGLGAASADNTSNSLVDRIASKFNLNRDEVEAVFDEEQAERRAERAADFSERLQEKVDEGDITAEQKTLIEEKFSELQTALESEREELEQWAEDNDIELRYLLGGHGRFGSGDYLSDAVENGDLTEEQKTLIEQKRDELATNREATREELEQWAEDNDIELSDIMMGKGFGRGGMGGPGFMH